MNRKGGMKNHHATVAAAATAFEKFVEGLTSMIAKQVSDALADAVVAFGHSELGVLRPAKLNERRNRKERQIRGRAKTKVVQRREDKALSEAPAAKHQVPGDGTRAARDLPSALSAPVEPEPKPAGHVNPADVPPVVHPPETPALGRDRTSNVKEAFRPRAVAVVDEEMPVNDNAVEPTTG